MCSAAPQAGACAEQAVAENETEAMDEARLAVQQIVLARHQPSELLPRAPPILALQVRPQATPMSNTVFTYCSRCRSETLHGSLADQDGARVQLAARGDRPWLKFTAAHLAGTEGSTAC